MDEGGRSLLLSTRRLEGAQRVTFTARPKRIAYLIDPADPVAALAAVDSACLTWGGAHQFFIPCLPGGRPEPRWRAVLASHDPDHVVDLVGADAAFLAEQEARWGRHAYRWERPTETMDVVGAVVFAALGRWKRVRSQDAAYTAVNFHPLRGHPLALPLAFRFGHLDRRQMDREMIIRGAYEAGRHERLLDLRTVDPGRLAEAELIGAVVDSSVPPRALAPTLSPGLVHLWMLPSLTGVLLRPQGPAYHWGAGGPNPEHSQHDEAFYGRVVVVGDPGSVPDLCLAWNLRAQRAVRSPFPMWISPDWLARQEVVAGIEQGRLWTSEGPSEHGHDRSIHLVSASLDPVALTSTAGSLADTVVHDGAHLDRFFTTGFRVGLARAAVVGFRDGVADVSVPDYGELGDWEHGQRIAWTFAVDGHVLPPGTAEDFGDPPAGELGVRAATDGVAGTFDVPYVQPGSLWRVGVHGGQEVVDGLAKRAGYEAEVSDKGRRAIALLRLVGGEPGLRVLASSRVYRLLVDMAEVVERQAVQRAVRRAVERLATEALPEGREAALVDGVLRDVVGQSQFDRQHWPWERVRQGLGDGVPPATAKAAVAWLVERRLLF